MTAPRDGRWFEELWQAQAGRILAYARRRTDEETAGEVVSGTFLVAWRRRGDIPADALPWLYGVARRVLADERRSQHRQARVAERLGRDPGSESPPDVSARVADHDAVVRALEGLGTNDREALLLIAWEQLTPGEAATAMGCSAPTFVVRLHRARRRLRRRIEAQTELHPNSGHREHTSGPVTDPAPVRGATDGS